LIILIRAQFESWRLTFTGGLDAVGVDVIRGSALVVFGIEIGRILIGGVNRIPEFLVGEFCLIKCEHAWVRFTERLDRRIIARRIEKSDAQYDQKVGNAFGSHGVIGPLKPVPLNSLNIPQLAGASADYDDGGLRPRLR
jgi:hypothetical protein